MNGQPIPNHIETKNYRKKKDPKKTIIIGVASALAAALLGVGAYVIFKPHEHVLSEWQLAEAPTCEKNGSMERFCTECESYFEVSSVEPLGHTLVTVKGKAPTVTEDGFSDRIYCDVCNKVLQDHTVIKATGSQGLEYVMPDGGGCAITGLGSCTDENLIIPVEIDGKPVTAIYNGALSGGQFKSVTLHDGITYIGASAFQGCVNLESIVIPDSVKEIGEETFASCTSLRFVEIPEMLEEIGEGAFYGCEKLESVSCDGRDGAIIPTRKISDRAFFGCTSLKYASVASAKEIGESAFSGCISLAEIEWCNELEIIGENAFFGIGAEALSVPRKLRYIHAGAFSGCSKLKNINFSGTREEWSSIGKSTEWKNMPVHINCTDGAAEHIESIVAAIPPTNTENGLTEGKVCHICGEITEEQKVVHAGSQGLWYSVNDDGETCTVQHVNMFEGEELVVPKYIDGYKVTAIGYNAFRDCSFIKSAVIPEGVTSIGHSAFYGCSGMRTVSLPSTLEAIENMAFSGCMSLESISFPEKLQSISAGAFAGCTSLETLEIPGYIKVIGDEAFANCTGLTSVKLNEGVETIGNSAFSHCTGLAAITVPESVTSLGSSAFYNCSALENAAINANIEILEDGIFLGCDSLVSVTLPSSLKTIEILAFSSLESLQSVKLPAGLTTIESSAFGECKKLSDIELPESLTSIGERAFWYCSALKSVTIPAGVKTVGDYAFAYCYGLETLVISEGVEELGENAFTGVTASEITIPASIKKINASAFGVCHNASFTYMGTKEEWQALDKAEDWYTGKEYVHIKCFDGTLGHKEIIKKGYPATATHEGLTDDIYCGICGEIISVQTVIPPTWQESTGLAYTVTFNGECAITGMGTCTDTDILIPKYIDGYKITSIGGSAFKNCGGGKIKYVTVQEGVASISDKAFLNCDTLESITLPEGLLSVGKNAFENCVSLEAVTLPSSVLYVFDSAFTGNTSLRSIELGSSLKSLGLETFKGCTALESIHIPGSVTSIPASAFKGCESLAEIAVSTDSASYKAEENVLYTLDGTTLVYYPLGKSGEAYTVADGVQIIGENAFYGNKTLRCVELPESLTAIGANAFNGCTSLYGTKTGKLIVDIPDSVAEIGSSAFNGCTRITRVDIPNGITNIGTSAFEGCESLTDIVYIGTLEALDSVTKGRNWSNANADCVVYCNDAQTDASGKITYYSVGLGYETDGTGYAVVTGMGACEDTLLVIPKYIDGNQVARIKEYSFRDQTGITSVTLPGSITGISEGAFDGCTSLESVTAGKLGSVSGSAFYGCESLVTINYGGTVADWNSMTFYGGGTWNFGTGEYTVYCTNGEIYKNGEYIRFSQGLEYKVATNNTCKITGIGTCTDTEIGIPREIDGYTVTAIGEYAFMSNDKITSVKIPEGIKTIGIQAFAVCKSLRSIELPEGLESIGDYAFDSCEMLTGVKIPSTVTKIGSRAFFMCEALKEIVIPEGVTKIESSTFGSCYALQKVTLPEGLEIIGDYAFSNCTSLRSIVIPESVENIYYDAFSGCEALESIEIPANVYQLMGYAFSWCTSLRTAVISGDTVGDSVFEECASLQNVTVTEGTRRLAGYRIFDNCKKLTTITLPKSLVEINTYVFYNCENLRTINYNGTVAEWQKVSKYSGWDEYTGEYTIYCTDGNITKAGKITYK